MNCSVFYVYTQCHTLLIHDYDCCRLVGFFRRMIYLKCKTQRYLTSVALCMKWVTINLISRLFIDLSHLYIISAHTFSSCFLLLNHRASLLSNATKRKTTKQRMGNGMQAMMRTV